MILNPQHPEGQRLKGSRYPSRIFGALLTTAFSFFLLYFFVWGKPKRLDGIEIKGTSRFKNQVFAALILLKTKSPDEYEIVTNYIGAIKQSKHSGMAAYLKPPTFLLNDRTAYRSLEWCAGSIAHDSMHSKLFNDYLKQHPKERVPDEIWTGMPIEILCSEHQKRVLKNINAAHSEIEWLAKNYTNSSFYEMDYEKRKW